MSMIIGIDLGTTNSLVACYTPEGPKIIPNRFGKLLTPSVVSIDENNEIYVGESAAARKLVHPETTADVFKRSMGSGRTFTLGDKSFTAEELSSFVLRALKEDAQAYLGMPVTEAVISVPAYFNEAKRKATKRAGELAGFKVERMISEPTAAAIAYGLYQKNKNTRFLVFDLGGGTFDVSILELFENILEVRAVAGDNYLGGEDFTHVLVQMFLRDTGLKEEELTAKERASLTAQAEACKLGFGKSRTSVMRCKVRGEWGEYPVRLEDYEQACQFLLERIRRPIKRSLADAQLKLSQIDEIVLVGGATKLSIVRKFVGKLFGRMPNSSVNPDEAVALGAAIQGAMKERREDVREVILTDVCPFTLGTEVAVEKENHQMESGHFCPIIERNTVIPASRTQRVYTVSDGQTRLKINVLQGESRMAKNNLLLGELFIDVPPAPAGQESVDITYTYDINALLEVEATSVSTGHKERLIIKNSENDMTDAQIQERMEALAYLKVVPREQEANKALLFRGERLYEESVGSLRQKAEWCLQKFERVLDTQDPVRIAAAREEFLAELELLEKELE